MNERKRRDPSSMIVGGLVVLMVLLIAFLAHEECGRSKVADCPNDALLMSPGTWKTQWCVNVHQSSGYMDSNDLWQDTSGLVPARCFDDEAEARRACAAWVPP